MSSRAPIPSAVERLAAVEAKRAAKDIRQAARGRWPAIVRIREREAKAAGGVVDAEAEGELEIGLERFVKVVRKSKREVVGDRQFALDFLRVAGYQSLQGEVPLEAQAAALYEAKGKLTRQAENLEKTLRTGKDARTGQEITLAERESIAKRKLEFTNQAEQLGRSISHFRNYLKEVAPGDQARKRELRDNPVAWFDLVRVLSLNAWEQNIAALDLFGKNALETAGELDMGDVLQRAGLVSTTPEMPSPAETAMDAGAATLAGEDPIITDEAAVRAAEIEEQVLASDELPEAIEDLTLEPEPTTPADEAIHLSEAPAQVEDIAQAAQQAEAESLVTGEKELPPSVHEEPGTGPPNERGRENVKKAQEFVEKGVENEAQVEQEKRAAKDEGIEAPSQTDKQPGGFWGILRRK